MSKHIEEMKKFKAPWWSRLLGDWRAGRRARKARKRIHHIATVRLWMTYKNHKGYEYNKSNHIHLYESGIGKRTFKFDGTGDRGTILTEYNAYHGVIIPWLNHRYTNKMVCDWAAKTLETPSRT